jgi:uncharacterized protein (DUF433 family)
MLAADKTGLAHVWVDDKGRAWVDDTNTKVIEIALDSIAHGWSPEEIHFQHPHLSLAQIHAALAYYYDHLLAFSHEIRKAVSETEGLRQASLNSPLRDRLRTVGGPA